MPSATVFMHVSLPQHEVCSMDFWDKELRFVTSHLTVLKYISLSILFARLLCIGNTGWKIILREIIKMERCIKATSEEVCLRLLLFKVLTNLNDGRTLIKFANDTDLIRMVVSLRKQLQFKKSRTTAEMV